MSEAQERYQRRFKIGMRGTYNLKGRLLSFTIIKTPAGRITGQFDEVRGYKNRKDAKKAKSKFLKHHKNLGKTVQLNESYATFTTSIPIVEVK